MKKTNICIPDSRDIWEKWEEHYRGLNIDASQITKDGIVNPERFNIKHRVLFVLKESNGFPNGSLSVWLSDGPITQMWHNVARWAAGVLENFPEYKSIEKIISLKDAINQIAIINLKKKTGGASSRSSIVHAFANQDRELLKEQIKLINPKTIIACGTFIPLIWLLDLRVSSDNPTEHPIITKLNGARVILMRHPNRADGEKTYYELKELYEK